MKWVLTSLLLIAILGSVTCASNQFFPHAMSGMNTECMFLGFVNAPIKQDFFFFALILFSLIVTVVALLELKQRKEETLTNASFYIIFTERVTRFVWKLLNPLFQAFYKGILCSQLYNSSLAYR